MFDRLGFEKCIRAGLKDRRFGKKRADEIIKDFRQRAKNYEADGRSEADAALLAMNDTFENMSKTASEKAKRTAKMLSVQAANLDRLEQGLKSKNPGKAVAMAAVSLVEHSPLFDGLAYTTRKDIMRGQLFAAMEDVVDKAGKGVFGRQKGKAHLPNIIREVFGRDTGDNAAKDMAKGWLRTSDLGVDLFNAAGGSMNKLANYIPDPMNSVAKLNGVHVKSIKGAKSLREGLRRNEAFKQYKDIAVKHWDWERMRHPDGSRIKPQEREDVIAAVFETKVTDGVSKLDSTSFRGQGRALGNMIDNNRFVHYKDADGWLAAHEAFGDGNVFDLLVRHVEDMSHRIAMIETFGPNPDLTKQNIKTMVKTTVKDLGNKEVQKADAILKNKFDPMMDVISRTNPMDPESIMGNVGTGLSNILTSAQLGSASLLAIPGDTMQTLATRAANKLPMFGGMKFYFDSLIGDPKFQRDIAVQSGFIADEFISATYATTRYTGINTIGPNISRRISDSVMRASLMSGHTVAARGAVQKEFMGMMFRDKGKAFEDLPYNRMMARYGITKSDWNAFRTKIPANSPKKGINFLRPIDALDTDIAGKEELFRKFQGMIIEEARTGVPESTIEAAVSLKGSTRPDTLRGLILHSFSMYKNFPVSFWTIYGRLGMTSPTVKGRAAFYAGLGAGMTMVGALGVQMREVSKGRDPLPMDDPRFYGKAFMAGGALSIWGDFLFAGVNEFGSGPADLVGGPLAGLVGDTTTLAFGDSLSWIQSMSGDDVFEAKTPERIVKYAKKYTPGTSIWWARLAIERQIWDRLEELSDPKAYRKRNNKARRQEREFGNEYWWPMGERQPERPPQYQGAR